MKDSATDGVTLCFHFNSLWFEYRVQDFITLIGDHVRGVGYDCIDCVAVCHCRWKVVGYQF